MIRENFISKERKGILTLIILLTSLFFGLRLIKMQIVDHEKYEAKSTDNSIKAIEQTPLRGVFYDRHQKLLVENVPAYTVRIIPAQYDTRNNKKLESLLNFSSGTIDTILMKNKSYSQYIPIRIKRGVDFQTISWIEENSENIPGVDYIIEMQRNYPANVMASHIFGYIKEVNPEQIKADKFYLPGDLIGYNGIEKSYEKYLRGQKGYNFILVDSKGRDINKYEDGNNDVPSIKGTDLVLSFDANIQRIAEEELKGKSGAVVAIEPKTGEILAMASAPDYDLNQFSYVTSSDYLKELYSNPLKPQYNRATMSAHPPGSTFKVLLAIAALESGVINTSTTFYCGGGFSYGGRFFKCHGAHGNISVISAIEHSCNSFFYQLIFKIGLDNLAQYAHRFGFGEKAGIDIFEESKGLIPTTQYYEKVYGKNWPRGILVSLGIGQGEISITPLQLAKYTALIANNGKSFVPHIVKGLLDENKNFIPLKYNEIDTKISQETFNLVKEGMFRVVNGAGTATFVRLPDIKIAGKTGTAQNPHGNDHAWFIAFAPYENPQIAVCVLVENAGFGATHAAPIAKKIIESYLRKNFKEFHKDDFKITFASENLNEN